MDKVKVALKYLQKYHFWLLGVIAMVTGLMGWMMASKALSSAYEQKKSEVVGAFSSLKTIRDVEFPPNASWTEGINKLTAQEKAKVRSAWEMVYNEQAKLLTWPQALGQDFLDFVAAHPMQRPAANPEAKTDEIPLQLRERYQNHIAKAELPRLAEIVEAEPVSLSSSESSGRAPAPRPAAAAPAAPGARPNPADAAAAADAPAPEYRIVWDKSSQEDVKKSLEWPKTPSSDEVRLAQENLWVYSALLGVIRATNEGSGFTPRVKQIKTIVLGKPAAGLFAEGMKSGRILRPVTANASEESSSAAAAESGAAGAASDEVKPLDDGRYVDDDGKPLASGATDGQQFKRMPIVMQLRMDQREISRLLVECANSPLPVEVRQLRISLGKGASSPGAGPGAGEEGDPFDAPVDICGIIYIYNPPDMEKLGTPAEAAEPAATAANN